jgi:hypothetical protein
MFGLWRDKTTRHSNNGGKLYFKETKDKWNCRSKTLYQTIQSIVDLMGFVFYLIWFVIIIVVFVITVLLGEIIIEWLRKKWKKKG